MVANAESETGPARNRSAYNDFPGGRTISRGTAAIVNMWLNCNPVLFPIASAG